LIHQLSTKTAKNRYPQIFAALASALPDQAAILSFGCSTGEELDSLREACGTPHVYGCEINSHCLNILLAKNPAGMIIPGKELESSIIKFDCITALSVLCRWPQAKGKKDISRIYSYEWFDSAVTILDSKLKNGGLLAIYNSNYRMMDASVYCKYVAVDLPDIDSAGEMEHFCKKGHPCKEKYSEVVFMKVKD